MFDTIEQARSAIFAIAQTCNKLPRAKVISPKTSADKIARAAVYFSAGILSQIPNASLKHRPHQRLFATAASQPAYPPRQKHYSRKQYSTNHLKNDLASSPFNMTSTKHVRLIFFGRPIFMLNAPSIFSFLFSQPMIGKKYLYKRLAIGMRFSNTWRKPHDQ